jgi:hypothetical protein
MTSQEIQELISACQRVANMTGKRIFIVQCGDVIATTDELPQVCKLLEVVYGVEKNT